MGQQIRTKAIVLQEMPVGDYDKRLILLTKTHGKVTAFVKGARRPNSPLLATSQVFAYGDYILGQGRNSYSVYQAQLIESFHRLRLDVFDMTYCMYMLEFAEYVSDEVMDNHALMEWLLISLHVVDKERLRTRLAVRIFELKAMSIIGFTPWLNDCVACHSEHIGYFSPESGGVICQKRHSDIHDLLVLHPGALHAMRFVLTQPLKEIYSFELEEQELLEFEGIMSQFVLTTLNRKFRTLEFLKQL